MLHSCTLCQFRVMLSLLKPTQPQYKKIVIYCSLCYPKVRTSIMARRCPMQSTGPPLKGRKAALRASCAPAEPDIHFAPRASVPAPLAPAAGVGLGVLPGLLGFVLSAPSGAADSQRSGRKASGSSQSLVEWCRP